MRFVVDCYSYVLLVRSSDAKAAAIRRAEAGEIEFLMTHLQWDEIACLGDRATRISICDIPRRNVPTYRAIHEAYRSAGQTTPEPRPLDGPSMTEHSWDANFLVSVAALSEDAVLVTDDVARSRHALDAHVEVWPTDRLIAYLRS